jgi:3,4-dihydroxy 2-butanone 4-phosphate synthase/GTP cyclohydrolase II
VADLVAHRLRTDPIVQRLEVRTLETAEGAVEVHRFRSLLDGGSHFAFVVGDVAAGGEPPLVRVHLETLPEDLHGFGSGPFQASMAAIRAEGRGALVYLRRHASTLGVQQEDAEAPAALSDRDVGVGAQILRSLGIHQMRLLTRSEKKYIGLRGFGLDIASQVLLPSAPKVS